MLERRGAPRRRGHGDHRARRTPRSRSTASPGTRGRCRWTIAATRCARPPSGWWRARRWRASGPGWWPPSASSRSRPGARNVIAGEARLSLDVRHQSDAVRRQAVEALRAEAVRVAERRGVRLAWDARGETAAVPTSAGLTERLAEAIAAAGQPVERLPSGAGHDGVTMSALAPIAMLFVRCAGGVSHNPAESVAGGRRRGRARRARALRRRARVTDLLLRGGTVVLPGVFGVRADVAIEDGRIAAIVPEFTEPVRDELDARGLHVLPGAVDAHVHFNEPGRADWEGWASGTAALAAGGATACVEMPLNAHPPTVDGAAFDAKVAAAEGAAVVDFALWGGLVAGRPRPARRAGRARRRRLQGVHVRLGDRGLPGGRRRRARRGHAARRRARAAGRRPRRAARPPERAGRAGLARLGALPPARRRAGGDRARARAGRGDRLLAARRARLDRRRRLAGGRGARARRRRDLRDLPALPRARRRGHGAPRHARQVRAAAAAGGRAARAVAPGHRRPRGPSWPPTTRRARRT